MTKSDRKAWQDYCRRMGWLAAFLLSGCAPLEQVANQLPTARYCSDVSYVRHGQDVTIAAACKAPFGGM